MELVQLPGVNASILYLFCHLYLRIFWLSVAAIIAAKIVFQEPRPSNNFRDDKLGFCFISFHLSLMLCAHAYGS